MDHKLSRKWLASDNWFRRICGAILRREIWLILFEISFIMLEVMILIGKFYSDSPFFLNFLVTFFELCSLFFFVSIAISACDVLTDVFCLLRKEKDITNCQIFILGWIGIGVIGSIFILDVQKDTASALALAAIGTVLTWIFQDRIKGAFVFIHLRWNKLLNIGDWIQVPKLNVNGEIKKISLTTVTLSNWDTTTSTIPISALQSEHFINLQNMSEGKTYGRRMLVDFTIDTSWIHPLEEDEITSLSSKGDSITKYLPDGELKKGALNIHLYRLYLYHWLMRHSHVSQEPRLLVRWMEHKEIGMVLQVYAFLTDHNFSAFEWQKSQIVEHILESMRWFGIRLYQSPSAYDAGNSNICLVKESATYKIKNA